MLFLYVAGLFLLALIMTGIAVVLTKGAASAMERIASGVAAVLAGLAWGGVLYLAT